VLELLLRRHDIEDVRSAAGMNSGFDATIRVECSLYKFWYCQGYGFAFLRDLPTIICE